jgi:hypothetical protein
VTNAKIRKSVKVSLQLIETHEGVVDCFVPVFVDDAEIAGIQPPTEGSQGRIRKARRWGDGVLVSH